MKPQRSSIGALLLRHETPVSPPGHANVSIRSRSQTHFTQPKGNLFVVELNEGHLGKDDRVSGYACTDKRLGDMCVEEEYRMSQPETTAGLQRWQALARLAFRSRCRGRLQSVQAFVQSSFGQ